MRVPRMQPTPILTYLTNADDGGLPLMIIP
jgi:hypothetical protein